MKDLGYKSLVNPDMSMEFALDIRQKTERFMRDLMDSLDLYSPYEIAAAVHGTVSTESCRRIIERRRIMENK